jgi:GABA(A) receptor-associated protein
MNSFKERFTLEKRIEEFTKIKTKYPDRIPIIAEKFSGDKYLPSFPKTKFLLLGNNTIGQLVFTIRSSLGFHIRPATAIFLFVNNILPPSGMKLRDVYEQYKETDGFLYCLISSENTFGLCKTGPRLCRGQRSFVPKRGTRSGLCKTGVKLTYVKVLLYIQWKMIILKSQHLIKSYRITTAERPSTKPASTKSIQKMILSKNFL